MRRKWNQRSLLHRDRGHVAASETINDVWMASKCEYSLGCLSRPVVLDERFNSTLGLKKSEMWKAREVPDQHLSSIGAYDVADDEGTVQKSTEDLVGLYLGCICVEISIN